MQLARLTSENAQLAAENAQLKERNNALEVVEPPTSVAPAERLEPLPREETLLTQIDQRLLEELSPQELLKFRQSLAEQQQAQEATEQVHREANRAFVFKAAMSGVGTATGIGLLVFGAVTGGVAWIIPGLVMSALSLASVSPEARDAAVAYLGKGKKEDDHDKSGKQS